MKTKLRKKGFSLIEITIYMGLLSILLVMLTQVFTSIIQAKLDSESTSSLDQDANYIMSRLIYDVSRATATTTPSTFGTGTTLQITTSGSANTYAINTGQLQITNSLGTNRLNSYDTTVSNLHFKRIGNGVTPLYTDSIQITFTLSSVVKRQSGNESRNYEITVAPR